MNIDKNKIKLITKTIFLIGVVLALTAIIFLGILFFSFLLPSVFFIPAVLCLFAGIALAMMKEPLEICLKATEKNKEETENDLPFEIQIEGEDDTITTWNNYDDLMAICNLPPGSPQTPVDSEYEEFGDGVYGETNYP